MKRTLAILTLVALMLLGCSKSEVTETPVTNSAPQTVATNR